MDIESTRQMILAEIAMEKERLEKAKSDGRVVVKLGPPSDDESELQTDDQVDELFEKESEQWVPKDETEEEDEDNGDGELEPIDDEKLADMCFKLDEIKMLTQVGLPLPSQITESEKSTLFNKAEKWMEKIGGKKGVQVKRGNTKAVNLLDDIMNLIRVYMGLLKPTKDQTGGRYKQNRRNAYKIGSGGEYGTLVIHLPGLIKNHILEAFKDGVKVMKQPIDKDTIDLLTKRFNGSKNYSELSKKVFNKLNQLSQIPNHRSSKKMFIAPTNEFQFEDQPEEQLNEDDFQFKPEDRILIDRLTELITWYQNGHRPREIKYEILELLNQLYDKGLMSFDQQTQIIEEYL